MFTSLCHSHLYNNYFSLILIIVYVFLRTLVCGGCRFIPRYHNRLQFTSLGLSQAAKVRISCAMFITYLLYTYFEVKNSQRRRSAQTSALSRRCWMLIACCRDWRLTNPIRHRMRNWHVVCMGDRFQSTIAYAVRLMLQKPLPCVCTSVRLSVKRCETIAGLMVIYVDSTMFTIYGRKRHRGTWWWWCHIRHLILNSSHIVITTITSPSENSCL